MGITSSMYVALSGLNLSQTGMEVASHNIANVNTVGYSRQRLNLETMPTWKSAAYGQMGTGVSAQNITRFHDEFLTRSIVNKGSEYGAAAAQKQIIDSLEAFFNESDGNGINEAMNDFFNLWESCADAPELDPIREELISTAKTLAEQLAGRRKDMDAIRADLNARVTQAVGDINSITASIAKLNQQIMATEDKAANQQANDLRDSRDALLIQLGEMIDIDWYEDPNSGAVNISLCSGPSLVSNTTSYPLGTYTDASGDAQVLANYRRTSPPWEEDVTGKINGGTVGGWLQFRDNDLRDFYLQYESFVDQLIFQVNNQHAQGAGLDLFTGSTGSSLISNTPGYNFSFPGNDNDIKIKANVPHVDYREPYDPMSDPENISVRFVKASGIANGITSSVVWNDDPKVQKWEITVTLPVDSNGNVTATAEDVIRHINTERSSGSGTATLPPATNDGQWRIGDFISAEASALNNWDGLISFDGPSYPSGYNQYYTLDRSLANVMGQGHHLSYGSDTASLTTGLPHTNNDIVFTAIEEGAAGDKIAVEYVAQSGANQPLSVTVYTENDGTKRISVNLGTDDNGNVNTTAAEIVDLIRRDPQTKNMVLVDYPEGQDGSGLVSAMDGDYLDRSGSFDIVTYVGDVATVNRVTVDPTDTIEDVVKRINDIEGLRAELFTDLNGQSSLKIYADTEKGYSYGFRNDSSGALAVLGFNNIFTGDSSSNVGVNQDILDNPRLLAAATIDSDGKLSPGDNTNGLAMTEVQHNRYSFYNVSSGTLGTAFNTFYSDIGSTNRNITTKHDYLYTVLDEMHSKQDALAGVNLDEELADILRYQYMYQASAKIVSTIDSMMETLLAMR